MLIKVQEILVAEPCTKFQLPITLSQANAKFGRIKKHILCGEYDFSFEDIYFRVIFIEKY